MPRDLPLGRSWLTDELKGGRNGLNRHGSVPFTYWLRLRVEGTVRSVVSGFGLGGGEHVEGGVQAPVVEPVGPGHGRELDLPRWLIARGDGGSGC